MNSITFDGRLAADSEMRYSPSGDAILNFRVASDIGYGEKKTTNWFQCQIWGRRAEGLHQFLAKGQQVTVYGQLTLREWSDKDGAKRISPDVRVSEISLQGGKREGDYQQPAQDQGQGRNQYAAATGRSQPQPPSRQYAPLPPMNEDIDADIPF